MFNVYLSFNSGQLSGTFTNSQWEVQWDSIMPEDEYIATIDFATSRAIFQTALPMPVIFVDCLNADTKTTNRSTIHNNPRAYGGMPALPFLDQAGSETYFEIRTKYQLPLYLRERPNQNLFNVKILDSSTNDEWALTSGSLTWLITLNFKKYRPMCESGLNSTLANLNKNCARPFNVLINSANGIVVNTKSDMNFEYDWHSHKTDNIMQEYDVHAYFVSTPMNLTGKKPVRMVADFVQTNNIYEVNDAGGLKTSQILGNIIYPTSYDIASMYGRVNMMTSLRMVLPSKNLFNIKLVDFNTNALFFPSSGNTADWIVQLYFVPIFKL